MLIPFDLLFAKYQIRATKVLHLGANTGQEAEAYARNGVRHVVWVEALPELMGALRRNTTPYQGVCLQACVSDKDGERVAFKVANNGGQSSSLLKFGTHTTAHPSVRFVREVTMETVRVDTLLKKQGVVVDDSAIWFLNIDLQGAELKALKGMGSLLWYFAYAYIEVNDAELYQGCPRTSEIDAYLHAFGFQGMETKMTRWGWGDKYYQRYAQRTPPLPV